MPIYTRTGDKGKTSLFGGKRVLKSDLRVETYGTVDELNSLLGVVVAFLSDQDKDVGEKVEGIQHDLLEIGSYLASPGASVSESLHIRVKEFEEAIDKFTAQTPELKNFILPGGGQSGAHLHHARTVCRRAERRLVALMQEEDIDDQVVRYLNRLSDLLFAMARYINHQEKKKETIWTRLDSIESKRAKK